MLFFEHMSLKKRLNIDYFSDSNIEVRLVLYLQEKVEALASVPPLSSLSGSSQVSPSLLMATREDQSFIEIIKSATSTLVYKVQQ